MAGNKGRSMGTTVKGEQDKRTQWNDRENRQTQVRLLVYAKLNSHPWQFKCGTVSSGVQTRSQYGQFAVGTATFFLTSPA